MSDRSLDPREPAITVRLRTPNDLAATVDVLVGVYQTDGYPVEGVSNAESWLTPRHLLNAWVAFQDGTLIGHILALSPTPDNDPGQTWLSRGNSIDEAVVLARLFVHKTARGFGVGRKLIEEATDWAARNRKRPLLEVMTKDQGAVRLYEKLGWERIAAMKHDNGHGIEFEAFVYTCPVTPHLDRITHRLINSS